MSNRPTFVVDRCLGKGVYNRLRDAGASVEWLDGDFSEDAEDVEWIPVVSRRGWVILTKDKRIRRNGNERAAVINSGARIFTLTSGKLKGQHMADLFVNNLMEIERISLEHIPPFIYSVGWSGLNQLLPRRESAGMMFDEGDISTSDMSEPEEGPDTQSESK